MGFTKRELVRFFDGLTGLISEEKQSEAKILIRGFILGRAVCSALLYFSNAAEPAGRNP